jgi:hypothetical protein
MTAISKIAKIKDDEWLEADTGTFFLSSQLYNLDVMDPDGARRIAEFKADPWPQWTR